MAAQMQGCVVPAWAWPMLWRRSRLLQTRGMTTLPAQAMTARYLPPRSVLPALCKPPSLPLKLLASMLQLRSEPCSGLPCPPCWSLLFSLTLPCQTIMLSCRAELCVKVIFALHEMSSHAPLLACCTHCQGSGSTRTGDAYLAWSSAGLSLRMVLARRRWCSMRQRKCSGRTWRHAPSRNQYPQWAATPSPGIYLQTLPRVSRACQPHQCARAVCIASMLCTLAGWCGRQASSRLHRQHLHRQMIT